MVAARRNVVSVVAAVSASLTLACSTKEPVRAPAAARRTDTQRMADTLAVLSARALADPMSNPFLNHARAQHLRVSIAAEGGGPSTFNTQHWLADELLKAGETREAIGEDIEPRLRHLLKLDKEKA